MLFEQFTTVVRDHPRLRFGHFFLTAMTTWWFSEVTLAVRRIVDRDRRSISLYRLIQRVRHDVMRGDLPDAKGVAPLLKADVDADLEQLLDNSKRARAIADRLLAHHDERGLPDAGPAPWRGDLYTALDQIAPLHDKYVSLFIPANQRMIALYYERWSEELFGFAWQPDVMPELGDFPSFSGASLVTRQRANELLVLMERFRHSSFL